MKDPLITKTIALAKAQERDSLNTRPGNQALRWGQFIDIKRDRTARVHEFADWHERLRINKEANILDMEDGIPIGTVIPQIRQIPITLKMVKGE